MINDERGETLNVINDETTLPDICALIASGGTLAAWCAGQEPRVSYKLVNRWIADDEDRARRYKLALDIREEHAKDLIIAELIAYLRADVTSCFDADGNLLAMPDMGANEKRLIAGVRFREIFEMQGERGDRKQVHVGNIIELKFWDKPRSIETFMKNLSMLVDRKIHDVGPSLADLISAKSPKEKEAVKT